MARSSGSGAGPEARAEKSHGAVGTCAARASFARDDPIEAGDVDWANHNNNIDDSIGATISGDDMVKAVTDWVEKNSSWKDAVVIVTADHGHYLMIEKPEMLVPGE